MISVSVDQMWAWLSRCLWHSCEITVKHHAALSYKNLTLLSGNPLLLLLFHVCGKIYIKFTIVTISKCTLQWHYVHVPCSATITRKLSSSQLQPYPLNTNSCPPPLPQPKQPSCSSLFLWIWLFSVPHASRIIQFLSFGDRLISLSIMFMLYSMSELPSFLWPKSIPL